MLPGGLERSTMVAIPDFILVQYFTIFPHYIFPQKRKERKENIVEDS